MEITSLIMIEQIVLLLLLYDDDDDNDDDDDDDEIARIPEFLVCLFICLSVHRK